MQHPVVANRASTSRMAVLGLPILLATVLLFALKLDGSTRPFNWPLDKLSVFDALLVLMIGLQVVGAIGYQRRLASTTISQYAVLSAFYRQLQRCTDRQAIAVAVVEHISLLVDCRAVFIFADEPSAIAAAWPADTGLASDEDSQVAAAFQTDARTDHPVQSVSPARWQFCPIGSRDRHHAAVGVASSHGRAPAIARDRELLDTLLELAGLALERMLLEEAERKAVTLRQREGIRAVLLAAISEDVKPRLLSIQVSLRALRRKSASNDKASVLSGQVAKLLVAIDKLAELEPGDGLEPVICGPLKIDLTRHQVTRDGEAIHLTPKEFALIAELARQVGRALPHRHLLRVVWGAAQEDRIDYLRVAIRALRQKLEADPATPVLIVNEPAVGYRLNLP